MASEMKSWGKRKRAKSTDCDKLTVNKLTVKQRFRCSDFVTDFVAVISSLSEGLGKMALGIAKIYLGSPFSANRRCSWSVGSRSVVVDPKERSFELVNFVYIFGWPRIALACLIWFQLYLHPSCYSPL